MRFQLPVRTLTCLLTAALLLLPSGDFHAHAQGQASTDSRYLIERAIEAMGGLETLRALRGVRIRGFERRNMLEQSERPEGPYIGVASEYEELRDLEGMRLHRSETRHSIVMPPEGLGVELVVADGIAANRLGDREVAAGPGVVELAEDSLALGPERVLLNAYAAGDLRGAGIVTLQGVQHDVVAFTWEGRAVSIYLNSHTKLPTAVERVRVFDDGFWSIWGDVTARIEYSLWYLEPGGLMYPRQWTETRNGMPNRDRTILEFEADPAVPEETFALSEQLRAGMQARAAMSPDRVGLGVDFAGQESEPVQLAPGIVQIPGMWNIALVRQPDGILVLEAPISSSYSEQVIAEVQRRFPEARIKALITTSDAWPHVGGIREYVARDVPIRAFELNRPLLERIIDAPRTRRPDRLSGFDTEPRFEPVQEGTVLGEGPTRAVLYPIRGEGGERMVAVHFPEHSLLYASDLIQPDRPEGFFMPSYLAEVEAMVQREELEVETVFGMHLRPTPWQAVLDELTRIRGQELAGSDSGA